MRTMLNETNADMAMQDDILVKMKNAYEKYNATFNVKCNIKMPSGATQDDRKNIADNFKQAFVDLETQIQNLKDLEFYSHIDSAINLIKKWIDKSPNNKESQLM